MRTGPYPHCADCPHPHDALECCIHRRGPAEIEPGWLPEGNRTCPYSPGPTCPHNCTEWCKYPVKRPLLSARDYSESKCCGRAPGSCPDCPLIVAPPPVYVSAQVADEQPPMHDAFAVCNHKSGRVTSCRCVDVCKHAKAPAASVLREAADIVEGVRNTTHGDKERSFVVIAELWSVYLEGRKTGGPVTSFDVAQMMVLLKIARSIQGTATRDHFVDRAGYSSIAAELANV